MIFFWVSENISAHKWLYVIFFAVCLTSIILGFVVGFSRADNFSVVDLPDGTLLGFIYKKVGALSLFFSRFFSFLCLFLFVWLLNCKPFLGWLSVIVVAYQSFLLGVNCAVLISIYKFGGVLSVLLVYFPQRFLILLSLIVLSVTCFSCCLKQKNGGCSVVSVEFFKRAKTIIVVTIVLAFVACFFEALFLPFVCNAIFIGT